MMTTILPSTELRNNFGAIEKLAHETREPIYLTKNGRGSLVIMDIDAFETYQEERAYRRYIDEALAQAECNRLSGTSKYQDMETAFVELLDECAPSAKHPRASGGPAASAKDQEHLDATA